MAIGEVAGRDSAAAIIKAAPYDSIEAILPTLVYTGTEYGNWATTYENVDYIGDLVKRNYGKKFYEPVLLGDAELWWALNGRFLSSLVERFGFYSPCIGCHLYMHLVRIPLARELGCTKIISGERTKHDRKIKINQTDIALDAYKEVLDFAGVELILPVREIFSGKEIDALVGGNWNEGQKQLQCVLKGNYKCTDDRVLYDERKAKKFLDSYIVPVGKKMVEAWNEKAKVDYISIVRSVLENSK